MKLRGAKANRVTLFHPRCIMLLCAVAASLLLLFAGSFVRTSAGAIQTWKNPLQRRKALSVRNSDSEGFVVTPLGRRSVAARLSPSRKPGAPVVLVSNAPPSASLPRQGNAAADAHLTELLATRTCYTCAGASADSAPSATSPRRGNATDLRAYVTWSCVEAAAGAPALSPQAMAAYALLTRTQSSLGVWGSVGEMRTDHASAAPAGHGFALAALLARSDEPLIMLDGSCASGEDARGCPARAAALRSQLVKAGLGPAAAAAVTVEAGGSPPAPAPRLGCARGLPRLRWLVIDGKRSAAQTRRDLASAACSVVDGGIVAISGWVLGVDDVSPLLPKAVTEGLFEFMAVNGDRLSPFLQLTGALYLTTPGFQQRYFDAAQWLVANYKAYADPNKAVLFGAQVVSHSVPDDEAVRLGPDVAEAVASKLLAAAGLQ